MNDYKSQFHITDEITNQATETNGHAGRKDGERNNVPIARDEMSEDSFNHMMETGYQQALEDDSFSLDEVFDQIEASLSAKEDR